MRFIVFSLLLCVAAAAYAAPSSADRDRARTLYDSGTTHYNLSEYREALVDFKEAYRLVKNPLLLYDIAQCQRQLGAYDEAARLYRSYRREYPSAPNLAEVDRLITQMEDAAASKAHIQVPSPTGSEAGRPSAPPPVLVAPSPNPVATPPVIVVDSPAPIKPHRRAWIWGVVAGAVVVVAAGVTIGAVLGTRHDSTPQLSDVRF